MKKIIPRLLLAFLVAWGLCGLVRVSRAELLVSDYTQNRVLRFNETNGNSMNIFVTNTNGLLNLPHCLAFGPDNNLYVASAGNDCILRYNGTNGSFIDTFVTNGSGGLDYPVCLLFRPDGRLYVSSQLSDRVLRYNSSNGVFLDVFITNNTALSGPSEMTFGPDGNLYVVGRFNNRVVRYNGTNGQFMDIFATNNLVQPFGLRFAADGSLLVVSGNNSSVQHFGTNGSYLGPFISSGLGGLAAPVGIEFGPDGNLYLGSFGSHKVPRYAATNGTYLGDFVVTNSGGLSGPNFMLFRPAAPAIAPPILQISSHDSTVTLTWPTNSVGFHLEQAFLLAQPSTWTPLTNQPALSNASWTLALPVTISNRFFRLAQP